MKRVSIEDERRAEIEKAKKENRPYTPLSDEDRGWRNQQVRYTLAPEKPFPLDAEVKLTLAGELHGEMGPNPMGNPQVLDFHTYGPMKWVAANVCGDNPCSYGPVHLEATNGIDLDSVKGKVKVTPEVELDWDSSVVEEPSIGQAPYLALHGKWRPGVTYTLDVAPGAADEFKQPDAAGFHGTVRTEDLQPSLVTGPFHALVEAIDDKPRFPVEVANLKQLDVEAWRPTDAELARLAALPPYAGNQRSLKRRPDYHAKQPLKYAHNQPRVHPVDLKPAFAGAQDGHRRAAARPRPSWKRAASRTPWCR